MTSYSGGMKSIRESRLSFERVLLECFLDENYVPSFAARVTALEKRKKRTQGWAEKAARAFKRRRYRKTVVLAGKILRREPGNREARSILRRSLLRLGGAAPFWTPKPPEIKAVKKTPPAPSRPRASRRPERVAPRKPARKDVEDRVQRLYRRGLRAYALGDVRKAVALWSRCLEIDPENHRVKRALLRAKQEQD